MNQNKNKKVHYHDLTIPAEIWSDNRLSLIERATLAEVDWLDRISKRNECFASNKHLAQILRVSESSVSNAVSYLIRLGLLTFESFDGRKRVLHSNIKTRELDVKGDLIPNKITNRVLYTSLNLENT